MLRAGFQLGTGLRLWEKRREARKPCRDIGYKETTESSRHGLLFAAAPGLAPKTEPEGEVSCPKGRAVFHLLSDQSVGPFRHLSLHPSFLPFPSAQGRGAASPPTLQRPCLRWGCPAGPPSDAATQPWPDAFPHKHWRFRGRKDHCF